jgi:hypothetical protein
MIFIWEVFVDGVSKGYVQSMTEHGAREQYYMKHGGASRYSGIGMDQITVKRA